MSVPPKVGSPFVTLISPLQARIGPPSPSRIFPSQAKLKFLVAVLNETPRFSMLNVLRTGGGSAFLSKPLISFPIEISWPGPVAPVNCHSLPLSLFSFSAVTVNLYIIAETHRTGYKSAGAAPRAVNSKLERGALKFYKCNVILLSDGPVGEFDGKVERT